MIIVTEINKKKIDKDSRMACQTVYKRGAKGKKNIQIPVSKNTVALSYKNSEMELQLPYIFLLKPSEKR